MSQTASKANILNKLSDIDLRIDQGLIFSPDLITRAILLNESVKIDQIEVEPWLKKLRFDVLLKEIKIINVFIAIFRILHEGALMDDLSREKAEFLEQFRNWFDKLIPKVWLIIIFPILLVLTMFCFSEADVSPEEVKRSMWDGGIDKSPGHDVFSFDFIK